MFLFVHFCKASKVSTCDGGVVLKIRCISELYFDVVCVVIPFCVSKTGIKGKGLIRPVYAHSRLGVFSNSLLEEVSFAL